MRPTLMHDGTHWFRARMFGLLFSFSLAACGGRANAPGGEVRSALFERALEAEAHGDDGVAYRAFVELMHAGARAAGPALSEPAENREGAEAPFGPFAVAVALDHLLWRNVAGLESTGVRTALFGRMAPDRRTAHGAQDLPRELAAAVDEAVHPWARALLTRAQYTTWQDGGDAARAEAARSASGCVRDAVVVGSVDWTAVTGARADKPLIQTAGPWRSPAGSRVQRASGCTLDGSASGSDGGTREFVFDAPSVPKGTVWLVLRAQTETTVFAGGATVLRRRYDEGAGSVERSVAITTGGGRLRFVVRVGFTDPSEQLELQLVDGRGAPVATERPSGSASAAVTATRVLPVVPPNMAAAETNFWAASSLALGHVLHAERMLAPFVAPTMHPGRALLYARALGGVLDLPPAERSERARAAYDAALRAWPDAWEARIGRAELTREKKGGAEGRGEALAELAAHRRVKATGDGPAIVAVAEAILAHRDGLHDMAQRAVGDARSTLGDADVVRAAERIVRLTTPKERADRACSDRLRGTTQCLDRLREVGDPRAVFAEIDRLRVLWGAPHALAAIELQEALGARDTARSERAWNLLVDGDRTVSAGLGLRGLKPFRGASAPLSVPLATGRTASGGAAEAELFALFSKLAPVARDAPGAFGAALRADGVDVGARFDDRAARVWTEERQNPGLAGAATAVLDHEESYTLRDGILHGVLFDVRRLSGTMDVSELAQAEPPYVDGRSVLRVLRRRVLKRDGRMLDPERAPGGAAQSHADLAQLEAGDGVYALYELWALQGESGVLTLDSPDLLPERTAVKYATLSLEYPTAVGAKWAAHSLWGRPAETNAGPARIVRFEVKDRPARRVEVGVPKMDGPVAVTLSTATWGHVGRALGETLAALDDRGPEVAGWVRSAMGIPTSVALSTFLRGSSSKTDAVAFLRKLTLATGDAIKESMTADLTDGGVGRPHGPQSLTARTALVSRSGSRTWLLHRALRELGVESEVVIAENEPFSADPAYPPHFGRFTHPLLRVALPSAGEVWVDADVPGPPMPPGVLTPALGGRFALRATGEIVRVPPSDEANARDEVDVRLRIVDDGTAHGSFSALVRGRSAQTLRAVFERIVGTDRLRVLRSVVLGYVPYATVDEVQLSDDGEGIQVAVRASIRIPAFLERQGNVSCAPGIDPLHVVFPEPVSRGLTATFARQATRDSALAISDAFRFHLHRRIELPKGATVARAPGPFDAETALLRGRRSFAASADAIEDDFSLDLLTGTIAAQQYGNFKATARAVDEAFAGSVCLKGALYGPIRGK